VALVSQYGTAPSVWAAQSAVMVGTTALDSGGPLPVETGDLSAMWSFLQAQLGKPYQWGGAGPASWDCSGLVMVAYAQVGVPLEHNAAAQYAETDKAALPLDGTANLEPGDLLFWAYDTSDPTTIHHVAIYVGDGEVVDAPHTGTVVQVQPWWPEGFFGATRPLALYQQPATGGTSP
jgi:cell wall-associated NlpC family hydrolase